MALKRKNTMLGLGPVDERGRGRRPAPRTEPPVSGTRPSPRGGLRTAVRVDDVGEAALRIAMGRRESVPRLLAARPVVAQAPLDAREAFVLSLVDGASDVTAIVDMAGLPAEEVRAILARLARLGLISGP